MIKTTANAATTKATSLERLDGIKPIPKAARPLSIEAANTIGVPKFLIKDITFSIIVSFS